MDAAHPGHRGVAIDPGAVAELCARHDIARLRVFGSVARGEAGPDSDVDLIADFGAQKSPLELAAIARDFSARLGRPVDLLTEPTLRPESRDRALREARVLYERPH